MNTRRTAQTHTTNNTNYARVYLAKEARRHLAQRRLLGPRKYLGETTRASVTRAGDETRASVTRAPATKRARV